MAQHMTLDIHDYDKKFAGAEAQVGTSTLSQRNKDLIFGFRDACLLHQVCGRVRLIRVMGALIMLANHLGKDFDQATREDLQRLLGSLMSRQPPYSPTSLATYKAILKRFMTWVLAPDTFPTTNPVPPAVAWIASHVRKRDQKRLQRNDLLTPKEIEHTIDRCHSPRDKALIAILWETGGRIAEIGNLALKHVTKIPHGYTLDVTGKTGQRSPIIVSSAPYLTTWLANHPFRTTPEAPLWVHYRYEQTPKQLKYDSIRYLLIEAFARAGVTKRIHPHIFRHSRATYVLAMAIMNESQAKAYFGWTPDSSMIATYAHLIDADANNAILKENNLAPIQQRDFELRPIECRICQELNLPKTDYCTKCGAVLNLAKAYEHQQINGHTDDLVMNIFRILVEKGLVDEAAAKIHDVGLGPTLTRLAEHHSGTKPFGDTAPRAPDAVRALDETPAGLPAKQ